MAKLPDRERWLCSLSACSAAKRACDSVAQRARVAECGSPRPGSAAWWTRTDAARPGGTLDSLFFKSEGPPDGGACAAYNHVPNIALSVNGLSASPLMTTTS